LPDERRGFWLVNRRPMTELLCATVRATLFALLADVKYLGARPGMMAALHTWSQTLGFHAPLHCLVTGGGLTDAGQWVAVPKGCLLAGRVVMAALRGTLLAALRQDVAPSQLLLPEGRSRQPLAHRLNKLGRRKWHGQIRERQSLGAGVRTSLAR
jgi:hypothetical protein